MPEINYVLHISRNCFGKQLDHQSIKEGLGGSLVNRSDAVKHYNKSEQKQEKELKSLKKKMKIVELVDYQQL